MGPSTVVAVTVRTVRPARQDSLKKAPRQESRRRLLARLDIEPGTRRIPLGKDRVFFADGRMVCLCPLGFQPPL